MLHRIGSSLILHGFRSRRFSGFFSTLKFAEAQKAIECIHSCGLWQKNAEKFVEFYYDEKKRVVPLEMFVSRLKNVKNGGLILAMGISVG